MKKLFNGVKSPWFSKLFSMSNIGTAIMAIIATALILTSCSKGDNGYGGGGVVVTPPAVVINMPQAPVAPLWNGGSFSGSYSVQNAPSGSMLYIDGVASPMSGVVNRSNLTGPTVVHFELRKSATDAGVITSGELNIPVFNNTWTLLQKDIQKWRNVYRATSSNGTTYTQLTNLQAKRKFFATTAGLTGQVWIYYQEANQGADALSNVTISLDEKFMTVEGEQWGQMSIVSLKSDTLELKNQTMWFKWVPER